MSTAVSPSPTPRRRGRPNSLDRDRIVTEALAMLEPEGAAGLTMNGLAQRLGVSAMTLYTYFPSREALLDAAADRVFGAFEPPAADLPWREAIRIWLWALYRLFERYPVGLRLIKWDGALTPSWIGVWMPLLRGLGAAGLSGAGPADRIQLGLPDRHGAADGTCLRGRGAGADPGRRRARTRYCRSRIGRCSPRSRTNRSRIIATPCSLSASRTSSAASRIWSPGERAGPAQIDAIPDDRPGHPGVTTSSMTWPTRA